MKKIFLGLAALSAAFLATSCLDSGHTTSYYSTVDSFDYSGFISENPDSVYNKGYFYGTSGYFIFNVGVDDDDNVTGGFAISGKMDKKVGDRVDSCNEYCAYNSSTSNTSFFAVYYQNPDSDLNPAEGYDIYFYGSSNAQCKPTTCYVTNTSMVADIMINGSEEDGIEAFKSGDYLKLSITGYNGTTKGNTVSTYLAKYEDSLSLLSEWTEFDLSGIGTITTLGIELESNRDDLPLYFCMDNFSASISEEN